MFGLSVCLEFLGGDMKKVGLGLFALVMAGAQAPSAMATSIRGKAVIDKAKSALRPLILSGLSGLAFFLSATAGVQAKPILIGSQSFGSDNGSVTSNSGDITTATMFHFGDIVSTNGMGSQTGIFVGMPPQSFGAVTLITTSTGFDLSNSVFGTFTSESLTSKVGAPFALFEEMGTFTAGSYFGSKAGEVFHDADLAIALSQVGGAGTAISFGATLSVPAPVPEPGTLFLVGSGLVSLTGLLIKKSRKRRHSVNLQLAG
jgi:hypothetical protein